MFTCDHDVRVVAGTRTCSGTLTGLSLLGFAALSAVSGVSPALAQTVQNQNQSDDLETIVVTAQRRSERLQDVPITITTLNSEELAQANVQTTSDIVALTPALRYYSDGPFAQPIIRGVGTQLVGQTTGTNVGTYVDGFYLPSALESDFQFNNVDNVEVLKGPQGTLFGRNTEGGAILVTTTKPSTTTHADFQVDYGSYNAQIYNGYVTTGVLDNLAVDLAAIDSKGNGYTRNIYNGNTDIGAFQNSSFRTGVKFDPTDKLSFLFRAQYESVGDPTNDMMQPVRINGAPASAGAVYFPGAIIASQPNTVALQYPDTIHEHSTAYQLTTTADLDFATLTSYSQYRKDFQSDYSEFSYSVPEVLGILFTNHERLITQEVLLNSKAGSALQWTAGGFFLENGAGLNAFTSTSPGSTDGNFAFGAGSYGNTKNLAGYGDATYQVLDRLFLTAGVRFSHDQMLDPRSFLGPETIAYPDLTFNKVTTRAVVRYSLDDTSNVYASFSQGFKAGIWQLGGPETTPVAPETINAYEVGYKYASHGLSASLAGYYYDWKNIQVSNLITVNNAPENDITNAADSHIYGAEGALKYAFTQNFEATLGAAYTHARYVKFLTAPAYNQCLALACGAGFGLFLPSPDNASGNALPHSPDFTGTLGLRYTTDLAAGTLGLSGNLYDTSKFYFDAPNQFSQGGYATLSLRSDWTDPSKHYTIAVYADNVTNRHYYTQVNESEGSIDGVWSRPLTVWGSIRVHF
jgi:iron complex outermembrane receptor protein